MAIYTYVVSYSFSGFQSNSPQTPLPAPRLDIELQNIQKALSSLTSYATDLQNRIIDITNYVGTIQNGPYGTLPITQDEGMRALRDNSTSGVNWLDAFLDGLSPQTTDAQQLRAINAPFWPLGGEVWTIVQTILDSKLVGGFSSAQLGALQTQALGKRASP